ncbi:transporter [Mangrovimicrobium sediminis]|uniref:Transporter n=1 Tax=Mangrovimicrobium sediminis TaxID=2562682 RepID=A0A4Z0LW35_9GAMM|nr:transporter [Haliea sp. SAOS-164]TGD71532.1 transporter [Haliea sp. SAOS-164]
MPASFLRTAAMLCLLLQAVATAAQEMTPRAYWPAPEGTQVLTIGGAYTRGDTVPDPSLPVAGIDSEITTFTLGYLRTFNLWGRTASLVLQQPYSSGKTVGEHQELGTLRREYQGLGDFSATLSVNLLGAPSMDAAGFAELRRNPRPIVGASLRVVTPSGRYDSDRLINVGTNRWAMKAEVGYIQPLHRRWLLEFELGAWFFEDNDDFLGVTREQEPIIAAQAHLIRRFAPGFWGSLDFNAYRGGRSTVNDNKLDDLQRDSRLGATFTFPFAGRHALKVSYTQGSVNDSNENFDIYQVAYQRLL